MKALRLLLLALVPAAIAFAQPVITTQSLPNGNVNTPYSATLTCTSCAGYSWFVTSGLPPGLSVNQSSGAITGTPTAANSYSFDVLLTNGRSTVSQTLSITINPPAPVITTTSLPNGTINVPYSGQLTCNNCAGDSWAITNGSLPPNISLNSQTGGLSGTPTSLGAYNFQVSLVGIGAGPVATASLSITIGGPGAAITTTTLPNGVLNQPYSAQMTCANCAGYTWSIAGGALPNGLLMSTSGAISGTPSILGGYGFQVALSPPSQFGNIPPVTGNFSINIVAGNVSIVQSSIPVGFQGTPYTTTLTATGGTAPYTWALQSTGNNGLTMGLNTGVLSGTPTTAGQFALNVIVTDSAGSTAMKGFALNVAVSLTILTTSLPNGSVGVAYPLQQLQAGGGQPPYRWTIPTGTLPPGITLDGVFGRISGTPTTAGAYPITLMVTDNQAATATANLSITVGGNITITPATLPGGTVGVAYTQTLAATGGTAPYTWSATGALPTGLTLAAGTGVISGTPTAAGTSSFTVQATDSTQAFGTAPLSIVIAPAPAVTITTTSLPAGTVAKAYSQTLAATGGQTPYTWSLSAGTLPAGTTLNGSTGVISGTPTAAATSNFTVQVSDANKLTATKPLSIVVAAAIAPITLTPTTLTAVVGVAYSQKLTAAGGVAPYTFSQGLGSPPAGFTFNASTATVSGTAAVAESGVINVIVTDSSGTPGVTFAVLLTANNPPNPTVTVTGVPATSGFSQQLPVTVTIGAPYPVNITGSVSLTFAPSVTPSAGVDDALIQFSNGLRVVNFTIPAGSTTPTLTNASSITVMTGTTAGTINVVTSLTAGGVSLGNTTKTIVNTSGVPFISKVTFAQSAGAITVTVVGFSSTRDMVSGLFHFAPATNVSLTQSDITVPLTSAFTTWWGNTAQSNPFGTQFTLTVPFTLSTQQTSIVAVTVTLTNSKGASNPVASQ